MYDYSKLRGRIREICKTETAFAELMGFSKVTLSHKLNGLNEWKQKEISEAVEILKIEPTDICIYFYAKS